MQVFGTSGSRSVQEYIEHVESIHDIEESTCNDRTNVCLFVWATVLGIGISCIIVHSRWSAVA